MTPSGIEPETFRFVAQHLNHCATAVAKSDSDEDNQLQAETTPGFYAIYFIPELLETFVNA